MTDLLPPSSPADAVPTPPSPPGEWAPPTPPAPRPHHRRRWIIGAIVLAVVGGAGILAVGLNEAVRSINTYTADMTRGSGDFPANPNGEMIARFYAADGYHFLVKAEGWWASGVDASTTHTSLAVQLTVRGVRVPSGAAFGPALWTPGHTMGAAFIVDGAGRAELLALTQDGAATTITTASAPALGAGTQRLLTLKFVAASNAGSPATLTGYVDGSEVITATPSDLAVTEVGATGMGGYAGKSTPAEWVVSKFQRLAAEGVG